MVAPSHQASHSSAFAAIFSIKRLKILVMNLERGKKGTAETILFSHKIKKL